MRPAQVSNRLNSSARERAKSSTTSSPLRDAGTNSAPSGKAPSTDSKPSGAHTSATRAPSLMQSFFGSGVPAYPAIAASSTRKVRALYHTNAPTRQDGARVCDGRGRRLRFLQDKGVTDMATTEAGLPPANQQGLDIRSTPRAEMNLYPLDTF